MTRVENEPRRAENWSCSARLGIVWERAEHKYKLDSLQKKNSCSSSISYEPKRDSSKLGSARRILEVFFLKVRSRDDCVILEHAI